MREERSGAGVRELWPLLDVDDLTFSLSFWRDRLGFELVAHDGAGTRPMRWCRVQRGNVSVMLQGPEHAGMGEPMKGRRGVGVCLYFICDDVDAIYDDLTTRGIALEPPQVAYYGMKQLYVPEPNGYAICFETPT